jgi:NADPH:quinone reductase-like Zn-dependent oxidoreductase
MEPDLTTMERTGMQPQKTMQAVVFDRYGSPDDIRLAEVEIPTPKEGQVLIEVKAASVNPLDWHRLRGHPAILRLSDGLRRPKNGRLGADLAGTVVEVGSGVTDLHPGDEVFGASIRTLSEYAVVSRQRLVEKPDNLTFEEAAAVPVAAITALQGLRDHGRLQTGQSVLINGGAGGVGTFAVQIAKALGAEVTAVCSTANVDLVRSLGADFVVDYTREDFTRLGRRFDLLFDGVGNRPLLSCRRVIKPGGTLVVVGARRGKWIAGIDRFVGAFLISPLVSQRMVGFIAEERQDDLQYLGELLSTGVIHPVIDRTFALDETAAAIQYLETGHARAKVVVTVPRQSGSTTGDQADTTPAS